jgi:hypothetical protein
MANGFLERHRSLSIAAFLGFLVLLPLSCAYLGLTGALGFIPPAAGGPLDLGLLTEDRCEPPCWQGPTPEDPTIVALRCAYLRLTRLIGGVGSTPPGTPGPLALSLLTGEPCEPPCWQGLTPGESTEQDVYEFVQTSELVDRCGGIFCSDITTAAAGVIGVSIQWGSTHGRGGGDFNIQDGVLEDMFIYPSYHLTLEDLIERYGPPDKFHVMVTGLHVPALEVTLFYPSYGFTADLELPVDEPVLRPESSIVRLWHSRAGPLETFIELGISYLGSYLGTSPEQWSESLRDWPGYGAIEVP